MKTSHICSYVHYAKRGRLCKSTLEASSLVMVPLERSCGRGAWVSTILGAQPRLVICQEGAQVGVTRVLTAFYFRQQGHRQDGERTFEFTHKSLGEQSPPSCMLRAVQHDSWFDVDNILSYPAADHGVIDMCYT
jgi:hypothetical protein